jgi:hypothetical protein
MSFEFRVSSFELARGWYAVANDRDVPPETRNPKLETAA